MSAGTITAAAPPVDKIAPPDPRRDRDGHLDGATGRHQQQPGLGSHPDPRTGAGWFTVDGGLITAGSMEFMG